MHANILFPVSLLVLLVAHSKVHHPVTSAKDANHACGNNGGTVGRMEDSLWDVAIESDCKERGKVILMLKRVRCPRSATRKINHKMKNQEECPQDPNPPSPLHTTYQAIKPHPSEWIFP